MDTELTDEEQQLIERYLEQYIALEDGRLPAHTRARKEFLSVVSGLRVAKTPHERAYMKWKRLRIAEEKRASETRGSRDGIPDSEDGVPRPGWFEDADWRTNRSRQRYDG